MGRGHLLVIAKASLVSDHTIVTLHLVLSGDLLMPPCHSGTPENLVGPSTAMCHFLGTLGYTSIILLPQYPNLTIHRSTLRHFQTYLPGQSRQPSLLGESLPEKVNMGFFCTTIPKHIWSSCCGTFSLVPTRKRAGCRLFHPRLITI